MGNDITIIAGIVTVFALLGFILPFLNADFDQNYNDYSLDSIENNIGDSERSTVGIFDVILSVFTIFFWTFGALPIWLDLILTIFRIILAITIARNVWIGGGG